jgi:hypothetical protein
MNIITFFLKSDYKYWNLLIILGVVSFIIRLFFIPYQIPITTDGIDYFAFSSVLSNEKIFPEGYITTNFGWPIFLSIIFSFSEHSNMLEMMDIQRITSSFLSTISIIPIFLILKKFFRKEVALVGASLFIFDPRIIENSLLGITEPLFILLTTSIIFFVFFKKSKFLSISFIFAAFATIVRYEGALLFFPIIVAFIINRDFKKKSIINLFLGISAFMIILLIINSTAYENKDYGIFSSVVGGGKYFSNHIIAGNPDIDDEIFGENVENRFFIFLQNSVEGYIKFLGWIMIPIQLIFVVTSIILISKKVNKSRWIFFTFFVFLSFSSLYAFGRGIQDPRYLYSLLPILCLFGCIFVDFLRKKKFGNKILLLIPVIIFTSVLFIDLNQSELKFEEEFYLASKFLVKNADGVNDYDRGKYLRPSIVEKNWPNMSLKEGMKIGANEINVISSKGFTDLDEYLIHGKKYNLTHLIITNNDEGILKNIFEKSNEIGFLKEVYKSENEIVMIKIFEIDYDRMIIHN